MEINQQVNKDPLQIEVISNEKDLFEIENDWNLLISKCKNPSVYSSFAYVKTAWEHFRDLQKDRLFIIIVKRNAETIAIAPFRIETYRICRIPLRAVRFISEWNGDRPGIITCINEKTVWETIINFFNNDFKNWDIVDLAEQTNGCGLFDHGSSKNNKQNMKVTHETTSYYIIEMNWEKYLEKFSGKTRREFKRKEMKLNNFSLNIEFQCHRDPDDIQDAFNRYVTIEKASWKKEEHFTVGGKGYQKKFYRDLFLRFAEDNMISIYLLRVDGKDISGQIVYHFNDIAYLAFTVYSTEYSRYSPGIELKKMVLKHLMGFDRYSEIDMLGMHKKYGDQGIKKLFSTNKRETYRVRFCRSNIRLFSLYILHSFRMIICKILSNKKYHSLKQEADYLFP